MANLLARRSILKTKGFLSHIIDEHFENEVAFLQQLIRAKSANLYTAETSPADEPVEAEVAATICAQMYSFGWLPTLHGVSEQRQNVLYTQPGIGRGKTLILNTHMDTVPSSVKYTRDPWGAQIEDGKLYGVGSADAKAQIAAFVFAARALELAGIGLAGTLKLAFVVDEETGASSPYGTRFLLEQGLLSGDAAIIGEPGNDKIAVGHRGVFRFRVRTTGESVHTGLKAWEFGTQGHNAALDMAHIIQALSECTFPQQPSPAFPGRKTILTFPTIIAGGSSVNVVPGECEAYGDIRLLPGLTSEMVQNIIERCLAPLHIPYELQQIVFVPAVETPRSAGIVTTLAESIQAVTGNVPRIEGAGPACDGWMFAQQGMETICGYGVDCGGVHGADEWVDLASLRTITEIYARTVLRYLGQAK